MRRAASQAMIEKMIAPSASMRLENSMIGCQVFASVGTGSWPQRGQLSQPIPEPVRRTMAPVATTR